MSTTDYRLAPSVAVRIVGAVLVTVAVLVLLSTVLVAALDLHTVVLLVPVILGIGVIAVVGTLWTRRGWLVRTTADGYRVQWVRGVGTAAARWSDVEDVVTATIKDTPVVVLRLADGRSSTIPVQLLAMDREDFVRALQQHLAHGTARPL